MASIDVVGEKIEKEIMNFRRQSYNNYLLSDIHVAPHEKATKLQLGHPRRIYHDRYELKQFGQPSILIRITLNGNSIKIYDGNGIRLHLQAFLRTLSFDKCPLDDSELSIDERGKRARKLQSYWWNDNGKNMQFLEFPAEIRNIIYDNVLGSGRFYRRIKEVRDDVQRSGKAHSIAIGSRVGFDLGFLTQRHCSNVHLNHFVCNRQIFQEASHQFYTHNSFVFRCGKTYAQTRFNHPEIFTSMRGLELAFPRTAEQSGDIDEDNHSPVQTTPKPLQCDIEPVNLITEVLNALQTRLNDSSLASCETAD